MEDFLNFLNSNLNKINSDLPTKETREGVFNIAILNQLLPLSIDPILYSRILYVRNLCLNNPIIFKIPNEIEPIERALMLASMNLFEDALRELNINLSYEVTGATSISRTGASTNVAVLQCYNTLNQEFLDFESDGKTFPEFKAQRLCHIELISLFIKIKEIMKNEDNETLKKFKVNAYLSRALWEENQVTDSLKTAFNLINLELNGLSDDLAKLKDRADVSVGIDFFNSPITFKFEILIQLGLSYKNKLFYNEAYECFFPYPLYLEKIDCLISLRKSAEASEEIYKMLERIENSNERDDRMIKCNLYIKLAHLYSEPSFFDKACESFRCSKPYYLKGLFYFSKKQFDLAVGAFQLALQMSPTCEKIRFSYACALIEVDKLAEAEEILKVLKMEEPRNENIAKNLSYCYYRMNNIEQSLISLKSVATSDPNSMSQFFILSVKNFKLDNVKWAFANMSSIDLIKSGVAYYATNQEIKVAELRDLVGRNRYVDESSFNEIFIGCQ